MTIFIITVRTAGRFPMVHMMGGCDDEVKALHRKSIVESEIMILGEQGTLLFKNQFSGTACCRNDTIRN